MDLQIVSGGRGVFRGTSAKDGELRRLKIMRNEENVTREKSLEAIALINGEGRAFEECEIGSRGSYLYIESDQANLTIVLENIKLVLNFIK